MMQDNSHVPVSPKAIRWLWTSAAVGIVALAIGGALDPQRLWPNLLLFGVITVGFGLGGVLLMAFRDLTGAQWNESFRCVRESLAATLPWTAPLLGIIVIAGISSYPWTQPDALAEPTFWFKRFWLQPRFFAVRTVAYLAIWVAFAIGMTRAARRETAAGGATRRSVHLSGAFLVAFSLTFWLASYDWLMSLDPLWYSTAFGVYNFGGVLLSVQAAVVLLVVWLRDRGPLRNVVTTDHLADLGTLLLSFSCFWMYIWFSQYMLIWYTNIPEETMHFARRQQGLWMPLFIANIVINWVIPFCVLLPRAPKRNTSVLSKIALLVLVGRWLDVYLLILPSTSDAGPSIGFCEIGAILLAIGVLGPLFIQALNKSIPSCRVRLQHHHSQAGCAEHGAGHMHAHSH